jgi:rhamnogalacturonyl hydrolase YesR
MVMIQMNIVQKAFFILLMCAVFISGFFPRTTTAQEMNNSTIKELSIQEVGKLIIENLLPRDYMYYGKDGLHYAEACAAVGALRFTALRQDRETMNNLIARYEKLLDDKSGLVSRKPHVDMNVIGIVPLQIYLLTKDKRYLNQGLTFADSQWETPREDGLTSQTRWWIDDMYMVGMLQMQAYRATSEIKYADRAAKQMAAYLDKLQKENGLFYHAPEAPFFWGRGNGWVAVAMAEVLDSLPENHELQPDIMLHYKKMMQSLLEFQSDNGMWRQLVDYKYSWAESSCTAMFTYAITVGINNGWLERKVYSPVVKKAWAAITAHIDSKGNVREICVGTGKRNDLEYYLARPRQSGDFHGQAPVLWLASELLGNKSLIDE